MWWQRLLPSGIKGVTRYLSWAKERGGFLGPKIHQTIVLSALSSDHGVRWLIIVRGASRDLYSTDAKGQQSPRAQR